MGREMVTQMLDFTYLGKDLRGKGDHRLRAIARGDDFSYDPIGSMSGIVSDAMITYYGLLCDDIDTKRALLSLRDLVHDRDFKLRYLDMYLYPQLYKQVTESGKPIEIPDMFIGALMDNADDILTIRDGYSYAHDTVIQIDGGEERGSGHSMAQGYFLYAFGEPFLDYIQVPYRDDVRAETWRNGISLQNTAQMTGTGGTYSARCGNAPLNQFYGMMDCPVPRYSVDYPDFREFPLEYGGDLEHYVGTPDARVAGVYVWRPYKNADPVEEYFIKYEDTLIKRTVVSNNREGRGVFHNFINIYDEFDESRSGSQLTFSRQGVLGLTALDIAVAWDSTDSLSWGGGDSGVQYCFAKNSCSGHNRGKGTYRRTYLHTPHNDVDFILTHHWYVDEPRHTLQHIGDTDKGVLVDTTAIVFDTSDDGQVIWEDWVTDGWGLIAGDSGYGAFNAQVVSHGGVELIRLDQPASFYVEHDGEQIQFTINTMQRSVGIDKPRTIRVAVNAAGLTRNSDLQVFDSVGQAIPTQSEGTWATFDAISGQNSDTYSVRGDSVVNPVILDVVFDNQTGIIVTTDQPTNVSITYGERSDSLVHTILSSLFERVSRLFFSSAEGLVYAEIQVCTPMGQCVVSPELFTFSVPVQQPSQPPVAPGDSDSQDPIVVDPVIPDQPDPHDESPADPEQEIPTPPIDSVVPQPPVVPEPSVPLPNPATTRTTIHGRAIDATSAQISVQTDEQSDVSVWYRGSDGLWLETDSSRGYRHRFMLEQLFAGHRYEYQVQVCQDVCGNSSLASFRTPSVERSALLPSTRHFDGATTDVAALEDLERVPNMTLERQGMGTIRFKNELNASGLDLDSHIIIEQNRIVVMVDQLHQLNQPAELEFQSVEFENPIVLRNGELCPDDICVQIEYENGSVRVVVDRFSVFEVVDMTDYQPSAPEETHTPPSEQLPFDQVPSQEPSSGGSGDTSTGGSSSGGTSPGGSSSGSPDGGGSVGKETGETDPQVVDHVVDEQLVVDDSIVPVPQQSIQRPPNVETPKQVAMRDFRENIARPINMMLGGFIMVVFGIIIAVFVFDRWKRFIDAE